MSVALDIFRLTVVVTMTSATELSTLIGFIGWGKPISWSVMRRGTNVCPLWNSPPTSDLVADATTCMRILHSMWIGKFAGGRRFQAFSGLVGSEFR